jgi:radical SAM superfamily enzyme YgiQ (UPF0313 family)
MKISLVQAPRWSVFTPSYAVALLTGNLRSRGFTTFQKGFDVEFYNAVDEEQKYLWYNENATFWNNKERVHQMISDYSSVVDRMVEEILQDEPTVVGFSVKIWSLVFSEVMAQRIKRRDPQIMTIFGGPQMSVGRTEDYLEKHPEVDVVCLKEADISLPNFLDKVQAAGGQPCEEPGMVYRTAAGTIVNCGQIKEVPKANDVPFADYSDYDFAQYHHPWEITMLMSRGCISRCSYCSEAPHFLRFRAYPAQRIFDELLHHWEHVKRDIPADGLYADGRGPRINHAAKTVSARPMRVSFNDSLLNGNIKVLEDLADLLIANRDRIQVEYGGMMLIRDEMTEPLVAKLAASGCTDVLFGLETGSEEVLKKMRKRYKHSTAEKVLQYCHDHKIFVTASVIFGHPGETELEFHKSLNFFRANAHNIDLFLLNHMGVYGESDISLHLDKYGIDPNSIQFADEWVGDNGQNTFEIRRERVSVARAIFGPKVADIGGFKPGDRPLFDASIPYKERITQLTTELAEAHEICREMVQAKLAEFVVVPDRIIGYIDSLIEDNGRWQASGWASDPNNDLPAKEVVLMNQHGKILSYGRVKFPRQDVAENLQNDKLHLCGWTLSFPAAQLDDGPNVVHAFAYDADQRRAYRLRGEFAVQPA